MQVKVKQVGRGLHPNEVVVSVETSEGQERLVVHQKSLHQGSIDVGFPISERNGMYLVELPRETMSGLWRVWVSKKLLCESKQGQAA